MFKKKEKIPKPPKEKKVPAFRLELVHSILFIWR